MVLYIFYELPGPEIAARRGASGMRLTHGSQPEDHFPGGSVSLAIYAHRKNGSVQVRRTEHPFRGWEIGPAIFMTKDKNSFHALTTRPEIREHGGKGHVDLGESI